MIIGISGKIGSGKDTVGKMIQYLTTFKDASFAEFNERYLIPNREVYKPTFQNKKFADKLKDIVCILLGCTREQLEDRDFKEKELGEEWWYYKYRGRVFMTLEKVVTYKKMNFALGNYNSLRLIKLTPRKILQLMGTECGREIIHPQIWVNAFLADYKADLILSPLDPDNVMGSRWIATDMRFPNELKAVEDRGFTIRVNRGEVKKGVVEHISETALDDAKLKYTIDNSGSLEDLFNEVKGILAQERLI